MSSRPVKVPLLFWKLNVMTNGPYTVRGSWCMPNQRKYFNKTEITNRNSGFFHFSKFATFSKVCKKKVIEKSFVCRRRHCNLHMLFESTQCETWKNCWRFNLSQKSCIFRLTFDDTLQCHVTSKVLNTECVAWQSVEHLIKVCESSVVPLNSRFFPKFY